MKTETGIKVGDIMTRNFASVNPFSSLSECAKEMVDKRVGSLIIKANQKLVGLITEKDILKALVAKEDLNIMPAKDAMCKKLVTIEPSKDIYEAMQKMRKGEVRWLPVIVKGKVIGMITMKDILKIQPTLIDIALQHWQIKEEEDKWKRVKGASERWIKEGSCDECGAFDLLYRFKDRFVCLNCKQSLREF